MKGLQPRRLARLAFVAAFGTLAACTEVGNLGDPDVKQPTLAPVTGLGLTLENLPPPRRPIDIAVYSYEDKTGQQKPTEGFSSFSKAVTQGSEALLIDVLKDVSGSRWFNVVERVGIQNLLNERNLIDQTQRSYRNTQRSTLPPLRFAGIIVEGGIINYDSNTMTSGAGARLLNIGQSTEYRRDEVTVALRAVSVNTGEVLVSSTAEKVIYSTLWRGEVFKFVSSSQILELEGGFSRNEPVGLAVRQAIELAVLSMIVEGAEKGLWSFASQAEQRRVLKNYQQRFRQPRLIAAIRPS
jgi:curli production assembly/transport component CsgG